MKEDPHKPGAQQNTLGRDGCQNQQQSPWNQQHLVSTSNDDVQTKIKQTATIKNSAKQSTTTVVND